MVTIAASETLPRQPRMPFLVGYSHRGVLAGELPLTWPVLRTGLVAGDVRASQKQKSRPKTLNISSMFFSDYCTAQASMFAMRLLLPVDSNLATGWS